jgi:hypothetical protein
MFNKRRQQRQWESMTAEEKTARKEKWKESRKQSNLKTLGTEWHSQTAGWKEKVRNTSIKKFGKEHFSQAESVQEKRRQTSLEIYGVDNVLKRRDLVEQGMLKHYGVKNPSQLNTSKHRSSSWKSFVFPSGKTVSVQGYEDKALEILLEKYSEDDLVVKNADIEREIGKVWYTGNDGKQHRYFPDIFVKSERRIVEVKSKWTYRTHKDLNEKKREACMKKGLAFEFMLL